jgi:hypothetical protein
MLFNNRVEQIAERRQRLASTQAKRGRCNALIAERRQRLTSTSEAEEDVHYAMRCELNAKPTFF